MADERLAIVAAVGALKGNVLALFALVDVRMDLVLAGR
jgi:hypothetical protein